jgi:hypothetical protein
MTGSWLPTDVFGLIAPQTTTSFADAVGPISAITNQLRMRRETESKTNSSLINLTPRKHRHETDFPIDGTTFAQNVA